MTIATTRPGSTSSGGAGLSGYAVIGMVGANITAFTDPGAGLSAGTTYFYRVVATNAIGSSAYSNPVSVATAPPPPSAPSNVAVTPVSPTSLEDHLDGQQHHRDRIPGGALPRRDHVRSGGDDPDQPDQLHRYGPDACNHVLLPRVRRERGRRTRRRAAGPARHRLPPREPRPTSAPRPSPVPRSISPGRTTAPPRPASGSSGRAEMAPPLPPSLRFRPTRLPIATPPA